MQIFPSAQPFRRRITHARYLYITNYNYRIKRPEHDKETVMQSQSAVYQAAFQSIKRNLVEQNGLNSRSCHPPYPYTYICAPLIESSFHRLSRTFAVIY